jgi:hypothetical protein
MALHEGAQEILAGANHYCIALVRFVNYIRRWKCCCFSFYIYAFLVNDYEKTKNRSGKNSSYHIRWIYSFVSYYQMGLDNLSCVSSRFNGCFFNIFEQDDRLSVDETILAAEFNYVQYFIKYDFLPVFVPYRFTIKTIW